MRDTPAEGNPHVYGFTRLQGQRGALPLRPASSHGLVVDRQLAALLEAERLVERNRPLGVGDP
jgi:hypothetical protein